MNEENDRVLKDEDGREIHLSDLDDRRLSAAKNYMEKMFQCVLTEKSIHLETVTDSEVEVIGVDVRLHAIDAVGDYFQEWIGYLDQEIERRKASQ